MTGSGRTGSVAVVIELHDLTKRYGRRTAVDGLSCTVRPGHVTGFLGPNGAGKTTTLRMILGLDAPTRGTATVGGVPFRSHRRGLRHVGALLDANHVHGGRSARAHLSALARSNGLSPRRVDEVLDEVGLTEVARQRVGGFSLGMRQRLGIATALLGDPPVLLFDEPINGMDPEGVLWVRHLFRRLAAEGRTVFLSSHLMTEMENTADQLVVIGQGRLVAAEPLADFAARSGRQGVLVRTPRAAELAALLTAAGARVEAADGALTVAGLPAEQIGTLAFDHRIVLHELATRTASLEDAFMELTADRVEYLAGRPR
ncbi:ABC transporter [Plantactinospora sp. BB1]|nr:ABC transporter [Plantactinospora sp. BB1]